MKTISKEYKAITEVNRSKFIAHLLPFSNYIELKNRLKIEHPKANHIVYACRFFNEFDQIVEKSSDDGEPKGCAGVPALNVLRGEELINCAVVIVRYFGGIKLGTGGMARAYALAVKNVFKEATLIPYEKEILYEFTTAYSDVDKILYRFRELGILHYEREFGIKEVKWKIRASKKKIEKLG
jgi:uncharacterized YigZ family protein